jgi:hypothetical protein
MPFDNARYNSLIARASFDCSFYKGTIQDLSPARRAMSFVGAPSWTMVNGIPALKQAAGGYITSVATPSVINSTLPFFVELLYQPYAPGDYPMFQVAAGGWTVYYNNPAIGQLGLFTYTAAPANGRFINAPGVAYPGQLAHHVGYIDPVGLGGLWWKNGVPVATVFTNTNPPAVCANTAFRVCGGGAASSSISMIARVWQGTPTNSDAQVLYQAARSLTGGEVARG